MQKVEKIREELKDTERFQPEEVKGVPLFDTFAEVEESAFSKLIRTSKPTTCSLDPIPTTLLKQHVDTVAPLIAHIINSTFHQGYFPTAWRSTVIKPPLKKSGLPLEKKNYRPVSNVPFISKLAEKSALLSFSKHIEENSLLPPYQSAYRCNHSTETLLMRIYDDLLQATEVGQLTAFTAIDLSAAFDLVDHSIMMNVLDTRFNVQERAAEWFRTYLADRQLCVQVNGRNSKPATINYSVPQLQGSVSGPVLFTCFASTFNTLSPL